jgi:hypothetical protein
MLLNRSSVLWLGGAVLARWVGVCPAAAQLQQIEQQKLPDVPSVHTAYLEALSVEQYAQAWSASWEYATPKAQVVQSLTEALAALEKSHEADPDNHELNLLTGLVAHFAYNVDVESAYDTARDLLSAAAKQQPEDIRGDWFLGIHECQALHVDEGMKMLLKIEDSGKSVPAAFWDDYMSCATTAMMPGHTLRAIDRAIAAGQGRARFAKLEQIANSRYETADLEKSVASRDAWAARPQAKGEVLFYSHLCGIGMMSEGNWSVDVHDVARETCAIVLGLPAGSEKNSGASILMMARVAKPGESLEDLVLGVFKARAAAVQPSTDPSCSVAGCIAMEVVDKDVYPEQGGAHLYAVAFRRAEPVYEGLIFEEPIEMKPPKDSKGYVGPVWLRPEPVLKRMPGAMDYLILLDANAKIFERSKAQFDFVLKSLLAE